MKNFRWIYNNIESFGGDKTRIRVWGLSAGGGSASQLTLSPYSQGKERRYMKPLYKRTYSFFLYMKRMHEVFGYIKFLF